MLNASNQTKLCSSQGCDTAHCIEEAILRILSGNVALCLCIGKSLSSNRVMFSKNWQYRVDGRITIVSDIDELRGHSRIDVHL